MRDDVSAYEGQDLSRSAYVGLWRGVTSGEVLDGAAVHLDLSEYVDRAVISSNKASIDLYFQDTFSDCDYQPRPGDVIGVKVDGVWRSITIVDAISNFVEERGARSITVTSRTRDGVGGWREMFASSPVYPLGTNYRNICVNVCEDLMAMGANEYVIPQMNYAVPHTNVQFSGMTPWEMLEQVAFAIKHIVFVNCLNQVAFYQKDTLRESQLTISNDNVIKFEVGRRAGSPIGAIKFKWLDPHMKKQYQQWQPIKSEIITAGFFKLKVTRKIWFSEDHTQRAENTHMVTLDSVNNGLFGITVADEGYEQRTPYYGVITLKTALWVPTLVTVSIATLIYYANVPDGVAGAVTVPEGRVQEAIAQTTIFVIMSSIGTGEYEIWGEPYDYVHVMNTTIARACNLQFHSLREEVLESVLVQSEGHARDMATSELLFNNAETYSLSVEIVDDPRVEVGDVLLFEDGTRLMVQDWSTELSRGSEAALKVEGVLL